MFRFVSSSVVSLFVVVFVVFFQSQFLSINAFVFASSSSSAFPSSLTAITRARSSKSLNRLSSHPSSTHVDDERKVVLITGCSTGIGKSTAEEFLKDSKYKVWATMRNPAQSSLSMPQGDADETSEKQQQQRLQIAAMDVTSTESVEQCIQHILQTDGKIDIVINNAGYGLAGCLETVTLEEAQRVFDVNVWGVVRVLQALLPSMRERRFGHIINLSSTSGVRGVPCMDYYTSSKFALEGLMDSMRYTMLPYGITVTNVNAGPAIQTSFASRCGNDAIGGKGTRVLQDATSDYLHAMVEKTVETMREKMMSSDAQSSESVAKLLVELTNQRLAINALPHGDSSSSSPSVDLTSIPFNVGTNVLSQGLLEETRKFPTGWGGIFTKLLQSMAPVDDILGKKTKE